jgi:Serine acetyltransferase, N-terminal
MDVPELPETSEDLHLHQETPTSTPTPVYNLGIGKNPPVVSSKEAPNVMETETLTAFWRPPQVTNPLSGPQQQLPTEYEEAKPVPEPVKTRRMLARDNDAQQLRGALWDERHFDHSRGGDNKRRNVESSGSLGGGLIEPPYPTAFYPDFDLSIPSSVYDPDRGVDLVWDLLRWEAYEAALREPILVSFLYSTILNHPSKFAIGKRPVLAASISF